MFAFVFTGYPWKNSKDTNNDGGEGTGWLDVWGICFLFTFLFGCAGSTLLCRLFSSCGGSVWASHCSDFSCKAQALGRLGFSSCRTWLSSFKPRASEHKPIVVVHGLSRVAACGVFPDQGLNLDSCTGSWILYHWAPGKPWDIYFL